MPFLFLCAALLLSCAKQPASFSSNQYTAAETVQIDQGDEKILQIAEDARRTLPVFFRHVTRAEAGEDHFCIKHPFRADDDSGIGMEQIWLTGIQFRNGEYYGILASDPVHINGMKKGDVVAFDVEEITDWMYVRDGKITGGRSIRYLLENIPESRRTEGQRQTLQMFDD